MNDELCMGEIDYSVIIRTLGKAGIKYKKMLGSINKLKPKPRKVLVVLPNETELPQERLGWETFIFCEKGMVNQRLYGINQCKSKYALVCDDDLSFPEDFVQKLYEPLRNNMCNISVAPLLSFFNPIGLKTLFSSLTASSIPTLFNKDKYVKVLRSSGWSFNRRIDTKNKTYYETESAAWTCFFGEIQKIRDINLEEEHWLDINNYAALDDQTMFFKAYRRGIKTIVVSNAYYEHLDAQTSINGIKPTVKYAYSFNRVVFWHRFIYKMDNNKFLKVVDIISFSYWLLCDSIFSLFYFLLKKESRECYFNSRKGIYDGFKYLLTKEYKSLEKVR